LVGSNTVGHEPALGLPGDNAACAFTVIVTLVLFTLNNRSISLLVLSAGAPEVDTTVTDPAVTASSKRVLIATDELVMLLNTVLVPVYTIGPLPVPVLN